MQYNLMCLSRNSVKAPIIDLVLSQSKVKMLVIKGGYIKSPGIKLKLINRFLPLSEPYVTESNKQREYKASDEQNICATCQGQRYPRAWRRSHIQWTSPNHRQEDRQIQPAAPTEHMVVKSL